MGDFLTEKWAKKGVKCSNKGKFRCLWVENGVKGSKSERLG
jgi:hypothetical protein